MADHPLYNSLVKMSKDINTQLKLEIALPGKESTVADVKRWIPTQSVLLNLLMGGENYGVATGRFIEIFGDYSHGKSTILQIIMNAWQAIGGATFLIDAESTWDRERALRMGHKPDQHVSIGVDTCEMGFDVMHNILTRCEMTYRGNIPILIGWDTLAASPTMGEKKGDEFESGMMFKARLIRQRLRQMVSELGKNQATVVFLNQTIEGKPSANDKYKPAVDKMVKSTPGGGGVKFYSSQRLQVERKGTFHDEHTKEMLGIISNVKMVKNKLQAPFKDADIPIHFQLGLDRNREVINYLKDNSNVIQGNGAWLSIPTFKDGVAGSFYAKDFNSIIEAHPDLYPWLVERTKEVFLGLE